MSLSPSQRALDTGKSSSEEKATPSAETVVESSEPTNDIDPEDEVTGVRLYLIHTIICLCTFLVGLVRYHFPQNKEKLTANRDQGFQSARDGNSQNNNTISFT